MCFFETISWQTGCPALTVFLPSNLYKVQNLSGQRGLWRDQRYFPLHTMTKIVNDGYLFVHYWEMQRGDSRMFAAYQFGHCERGYNPECKLSKLLLPRLGNMLVKNSFHLRTVVESSHPSTWAIACCRWTRRESRRRERGVWEARTAPCWRSRLSWHTWQCHRMGDGAGSSSPPPSSATSAWTALYTRLESSSAASTSPSTSQKQVSPAWAPYWPDSA